MFALLPEPAQSLLDTRTADFVYTLCTVHIHCVMRDDALYNVRSLNVSIMYI